jgi:hypothetical protein
MRRFVDEGGRGVLKVGRYDDAEAFMRVRSRFRNYVTLEALVVAAVLLSFHFIPVKDKAAVVAGTLFLLSTIFILVYESRFPGAAKRATFWGALLFLVASAIPIFSLRVFHWGTPFNQLSLFGIPGPRLHEFSNYLFLILVVCFFIDDYLWKQKELQKLPPDQK